jgi:hypothetical protein
MTCAAIGKRFAPAAAIGFPISAATNWAEESAVLLIVGGLSMLALIFVLVILAALMPGRRDSPTEATTKLQGALRDVWVAPPPRSRRPPNQGTGDGMIAAAGRRLAEGIEHGGLDRLLDEYVKTGRGEPRILQHEPDSTLLRIHWRTDPPPDTDTPCDFERAYFATGFSRLFGDEAEVIEVACDRRDASACDFEVRR